MWVKSLEECLAHSNCCFAIYSCYCYCYCIYLFLDISPLLIEYPLILLLFCVLKSCGGNSSDLSDPEHIIYGLMSLLAKAKMLGGRDVSFASHRPIPYFAISSSRWCCGAFSGILFSCFFLSSVKTNPYPLFLPLSCLTNMSDISLWKENSLVWI